LAKKHLLLERNDWRAVIEHAGPRTALIVVSSLSGALYLACRVQQDGWAALAEASWEGHAAIVQVLVEAGSILNLQDTVVSGRTDQALTKRHVPSHCIVLRALLGLLSDIVVRTLLSILRCLVPRYLYLMVYFLFLCIDVLCAFVRYWIAVVQPKNLNLLGLRC
jgi:predicted neutral ceramidase superfamily lipid hydrolase